MKKGKIFYRPIEGSAPLSISWCSGHKGNAVEALNELGVGFFSPDNRLLGVIFDDVCEKRDHQVLTFKTLKVELEMKNGKASINVVEKSSKSKNTAA